MEIRGCVVIVTGSASGIGRATAIAFAEEGARGVVLADVDEAGMEETAARVREAGADALGVPTDVSAIADQRRLFERSVAHFGRIDVLHNNAGVASGDPFWPDSPLERVALVADVNLKGVLLGTRLAIEQMRKQEGGGVIVHTSSGAGHVPLLPESAYCASKAGVEMLTRSCEPLAREIGVRVNCVCPGLIDTPMLARASEVEDAYLRPILDSVELLPPRAIADAVLELVRDDSRNAEVVDVTNAPKA